MQCAVWDGRTNTGDYGTASSIALWIRTGLRQRIFDLTGAPQEGARSLEYPLHSERDIRYVLFADFAGFGQLSESHVVTFATHVMGTVAGACASFSDQILAKNTWGDGVFLVFSRAASAAETALKMQEAVSAIDFKKLGFC